jgi:hypothetical protein
VNDHFRLLCDMLTDAVFIRGHYTTIRKIGTQWWHCDDSKQGGIIPLTRAEVGNHEDGCIFLLKKIGDGDVDEET